jgi:hypothetical protein
VVETVANVFADAAGDAVGRPRGVGLRGHSIDRGDKALEQPDERQLRSIAGTTAGDE